MGNSTPGSRDSIKMIENENAKNKKINQSIKFITSVPVKNAYDYIQIQCSRNNHNFHSQLHRKALWKLHFYRMLVLGNARQFYSSLAVHHRYLRRTSENWEKKNKFGMPFAVRLPTSNDITATLKNNRFNMTVLARVHFSTHDI